MLAAAFELVIESIAFVIAGVMLTYFALERKKDQLYYYLAPDIFTAIKQDDIETARTIINTPGFDPNQLDEDGNTPLCIAARQNRFEMTEMLLDIPNIKINQKGNYARPLEMALEKKHRDLAVLLVEHGSRLENRKTPLHYIASNYSSGSSSEQIEAATFWLAQGVNINQTDIHGDTALHCAILYTNTRFLTFLVENNADINTLTNNGGETPLTRAQKRHKLNYQCLRSALIQQEPVRSPPPILNATLLATIEPEPDRTDLWAQQQVRAAFSP